MSAKRATRDWIGLGGLLALAFAAQWAPSAEAFEFSADRIFRDGGKVVRARVYARDDRWRFEYAEPQAGAMVTIVRADHQLAWHLLSKRRVFLEVPLAPDHLLLVSEKMEGELSRDLIGVQDLNGYPCELFEVSVLVSGQVVRYYQWVTKVERFSIKTVRKQGDWSVEYQKVRFEKQSARLFEPPYGFSRDTPLTAR